MPQSPDFIRELHPGEETAVEQLLQKAFRGNDQAALVRHLRKQGDMAGEQVLPLGERIIGYYALSHMKSPKGWLCLAPVAIHPDYQGQGHGRRMIGQLTEWARLARAHVVVLGEPGFYEKAGFSHARAARMTSPYPISHTLLAGPGEQAPEVTLTYPSAFGQSG
ncbi:MAG: GNAT family N-acetyltransferase [Rhodobacterales bacterium]|nr:MAG: GNAT family N-acetyltransferase [Rhodobacterales bacterium]